jgi:putative membrane protein
MKSGSAEEFFSPAEQELIRQAVATAEKSTSGEIATMVVTRSDLYEEAVTLAAVFAAALAALLIAVAGHHVTIWTYIPLTFIIYFPARRLVKLAPRLQRPFISSNRLEEAVRQRAVRAFYEKGLYRTRNETGILIFISTFERKVWILGDRGINARIPAESWQRLVQLLTAGIRDGQACAALCTVIDKCGAELARHFPPESDAANELQDELLLEQCPPEPTKAG